MPGRLITFTNLFPSAAFPHHGLFVRERMRRVAAASGLDWVVVCPVPRAPRGLRRGDYAKWAAMPEREEVDGVEVWHPPYRHLPGFSTAKQAARMAAASRAVVARLADGCSAVLDAHYVYPDGVAALELAARLGIPALVTARGSDLNVVAAIPAVAKQIRKTVPEAFARLAVSEPLRRKFATVAQIPGETVQLARNGVDLDLFCPGERAEARRELDLPEDAKVAVGVGRLVKSKGFHHMLEALEREPELLLVLVGDGPEQAALQEAAPAGRVRFLGSRPPAEVAVAYRACDVAVLPSDREGWPNVVTEALACGAPVVATDVGAVPQMLADPEVGAIVPVGDARALADRVQRFLKSAPDPSKIRAYAERFSWEEPVALLTELLRRAVQ